MIFTTLEPGSLKTSGGQSPMADVVNQIMNDRRKNQEKSDTKAATIRGLNDVRDVISVMNGPKDAAPAAATDPVVLTPPTGKPKPPASGPMTMIFSEDFESTPPGSNPGTAHFKPSLQSNPDVQPWNGSNVLALNNPGQLTYFELPRTMGDFETQVVEFTYIVG